MERLETYLFDVDGTLTAPRQKMDTSSVFYFLDFLKNKNFFLITGSDLPKLSEQIPHSILSRANGYFTCMGNEFHIGKDKIYENKFTCPDSLNTLLLNFKTDSQCPNKKTDYIETRIGMVNFSTLGRNATKQERDEYEEWDKEHKEREAIVKILTPKYPYIEFKIGGQISIDIFPKGYDKAYAYYHLLQNNLIEKENTFFFGDKCSKKGNDHSIYTVNQINGGQSFHVVNHNQTFSILKDLIN